MRPPVRVLSLRPVRTEPEAFARPYAVDEIPFAQPGTAP